MTVCVRLNKFCRPCPVLETCRTWVFSSSAPPASPRSSADAPLVRIYLPTLEPGAECLYAVIYIKLAVKKGRMSRRDAGASDRVELDIATL